MKLSTGLDRYDNKDSNLRKAAIVNLSMFLDNCVPIPKETTRIAKNQIE